MKNQVTRSPLWGLSLERFVGIFSRPSMHRNTNLFCIGLFVVLLIEIILFSIASPYFLSATNLANVGRATVIIGIVAVGQTIVIISGGFDLSVGATMAAGGMIAAFMVNNGAGTGLGLLAAVVFGLLVGALNGFVSAYLRVNPFITTLATMSIIRGLAYVITGGEAIVISDETFLGIGTDKVLGVPIVVILLVVPFVVIGSLMPRTRFGRYVYAIGSSRRASRLAGIQVNRWLLLFYMLCGILAAFAGFVQVARTGQAQPASNIGVELLVITAVILGGASLSGGSGRLFGTFLAIAVLAVLSNGMILVGIPSYWQLVVSGVVLLGAVILGVQRTTSPQLQ